jgi:hypothetical protein
MDREDVSPRLAGAAFLTVFVTSLISALANDTAMGSGSVTDVLTKVSDHTGLVHVGNLFGLLNAVGILVLATALAMMLRGQSRTLATVALLCWTGEAFVYTLAQVITAGLAGTAEDFRAAGGAEGAGVDGFRALGAFLADGYHRSGTILMFFYCAGGLLFSTLLYRSQLLPRWIPVFGLAVVAVGTVGAAVEVLGPSLGLWPYIAIAPFELIVGVALLTRRTKTGSISALADRVAV